MNNFAKILGLIVVICAIFFVLNYTKLSNQNINNPVNVINDMQTNSKNKEESPLSKDTTSNGGVFCAMDAKMCEDGSYVSRVGPNCEFAQCPVVNNSLHILNKTVEYNGVFITPLKVVEDSRCPSGVQCAWAGRLVVLTRLEYKSTKEETSLEIMVPHKIGDKTVILAEGEPYPGFGDQNKSSVQYFSFEVR